MFFTLYPISDMHCYMFFQKDKITFESRKPPFEFRYIEYGECTVTTGNSKLVASAGDVIFIPANTSCTLSHHKKSGSGVSGKVFIAPDMIDSNEWNYPPQIIKSSPEVTHAATELPAKSAHKIHEKNYEYLSKVMWFLHIMQKNLNNAAPQPTKLLSKAKAFMKNNNNYTVGDIARHCNISESYLYKLFEKHLDTTPVLFKQKITAEKAANLLVFTDLSIGEIVNKIGISSDTHFRKIFYNRFSCTPKEYRKKYGKSYF